MVSVQIAALCVALSSGGETTLLDFQAPWCAPCRSMDSTIAQLEQAGYPVRKVNIDRQRQLATQYNVQNIPCFVMIVDGKEVGRVNGAVRRAELLGLYAKAGIGPSASSRQTARAQSPDPGADEVPWSNETDRAPLDRARSAATDGGSASRRAPAQTITAQDLIQVSVRLSIEDAKGISHGSGTLIDSRQGEALVLTCGHIFRDSAGKGKITVDLFLPQAPQKLPGRLVGYDEKNDVGLVSIRPGVPVSVAPVAPRGYRVTKGDRVVTVGCNNGGAATAQESRITSIDKFLGPPNLQVAGLPVQGRSGGGLFSADGQVIGVCNAADPADEEGLYAALPSIHRQLDQAGLAAVYENRPTRGEPSVADTASMTNLPRPVAESPFTRGRLPSAGSQTRFEPQAGASAGLSDSERAALAQVQKRGDGAEVICIVRSLSDPQAKSEVFVLDRASPEFLKQLATDNEAQEARHLTSARSKTK